MPLSPLFCLKTKIFTTFVGNQATQKVMMKIRKIVRQCFIFVPILWFFAACTSQVEQDARQAAEYTQKALEHTMKMEFREAEAAQKEAEKILEKYQSNASEETSDFAELYVKFLSEE